jgi:hypothetical protein
VGLSPEIERDSEVTNDISSEAVQLSRYLLGVQPSDQARLLYSRAVQLKSNPLSPREKTLWRVMLKRNWLIPYVDAGLSIVDHYNPIRQRIFLMSCVLETQPLFSSYFLPRKFNFKEKLSLILKSLLAVFHLVVGSIGVKIYFVLHFGPGKKLK